MYTNASTDRSLAARNASVLSLKVKSSTTAMVERSFDWKTLLC